MKILKPISNLTLTVDLKAVKYWMGQDYHCMSEMGILAPNERTELMNGQIVLKVAKSPAYVLALRWLSNELDTLPENQPFSSVPKTRFDWMIGRSRNRIWRSHGALFWIMRIAILVPAILS